MFNLCKLRKFKVWDRAFITSCYTLLNFRSGMVYELSLELNHSFVPMSYSTSAFSCQNLMTIWAGSCIKLNELYAKSAYPKYYSLSKWPTAPHLQKAPSIDSKQAISFVLLTP